MTSRDYYPFKEGPLFPDDSAAMIDDCETYLSAIDRDTEAEATQQETRFLAQESFRSWLQETLQTLNMPEQPEEK